MTQQPLHYRTASEVAAGIAAGDLETPPNAIMALNSGVHYFGAKPHESRSEEERVVLDAHFRSRLSQLSGYEYITEETGGFKYDWRDVVPVVIRQTFDYEYARIWWSRKRENRKSWAPGVKSMFDEALGFSD